MTITPKIHAFLIFHINNENLYYDLPYVMYLTEPVKNVLADFAR